MVPGTCMLLRQTTQHVATSLYMEWGHVFQYSTIHGMGGSTHLCTWNGAMHTSVRTYRLSMRRNVQQVFFGGVGQGGHCLEELT